jgi:hypothetical protein
VEFIDHPGEGGREVVTRLDLEVAPARFERNGREARVGPVCRERCRVEHGPALARRGAAPHPDRVDHHPVALCAVHHERQRDERLAELHRPRVLAVAQHQHDAAPSALRKPVERGIHGGPQRRRRVGRNRGRERRVERRRVAGERRADGDLAAERADSHLVVGTKSRVQLPARLAEDAEIPVHASAHVEQDDEADRLRCVVEERDRLRLAVVEDLEVLASQRRDEPAVLVGHGGEDGDGLRRPSKHGRLLRRARETERERDNGAGNAGARQQPSRTITTRVSHPPDLARMQRTDEQDDGLNHKGHRDHNGQHACVWNGFEGPATGRPRAPPPRGGPRRGPRRDTPL